MTSLPSAVLVILSPGDTAWFDGNVLISNWSTELFPDTKKMKHVRKKNEN